ncbi:MOSC domain-containing protein [Pseudoalteromonas denitrificans]|uniref:MOSC domain-containing protein YiiM n=1 Tax=Pseudoalteromonas denitrificans DSM 6059 TaxID=1123010 RepID=A0A1I1G432_9GAMM|nr:MOSC domain-containing protein [Pseudoalteromonas denitrificans]SFC06062.1 MOSC domain-containing protein YiiM [Pseudoalteromonas denitrificans DSM 6059]
MQILGTLERIFIGKAIPFEKKGTDRVFKSAINKSLISGPVNVNEMGIIGDEVGDTKIHGGIDKAVHLYPSEHYEFWKSELENCNDLNQFGAFGENLSTSGISEKDVCLGDEIKIGTCVFEVVQTRQPCWKLNVKFERNNMSRLMQDSLKTGWYFKVLQVGVMVAGDDIILINRPNPSWSLNKVVNLLYKDKLNYSDLSELAKLRLVPSWQKMVTNRLKNKKVEDWTGRLEGKD